MTTENALHLVNTALGTNTKINDLRYCVHALAQVEAVKEVSDMVERMGSTLRSRQAIAVIIYTTPQPDVGDQE